MTNFEKFTQMNKIALPKFIVFAKRKSIADSNVSLYVRIYFGRNIHEKSLGIKCSALEWDSEDLTTAYIFPAEPSCIFSEKFWLKTDVSCLSDDQIQLA